jgi:hypothetical protein
MRQPTIPPSSPAKIRRFDIRSILEKPPAPLVRRRVRAKRRA